MNTLVTVAVYCRLCDEEQCGQMGVNLLIQHGIPVLQPKEFQTIDGPPPVSSWTVPDDLSHYCVVQFETPDDPGEIEIVAADRAVFRENDYPEPTWIRELIGTT